MSIVEKTEHPTATDSNKRVEVTLLKLNTNKKGESTDEIASYSPTEEEKEVRALILKHFIIGTTNQYTPRVEFNDLSLLGRDEFDQMSFNTYQPNNGEGYSDATTNWRSRAIRPVVRNKCISIAAHATARLIFPKVFAYNDQNDEQQNAAIVMEDLMEWSGDVSNYAFTALMRVITAMSSPASIGYTEYGEVTRMVKDEKEDGKWKEKEIRDESYPCFMDCVVPVDQLYVQNFFEPDIQKQGWLIWRKVIAFSEAQIKYNKYDNFKYVKSGIQTIYNDANNTFYYVYDPNMRSEYVEEIIYWNKNFDLKIILVNGVMITSHDNPNPRNDKLYPFDKFGYEPINNKFFYYKSLAFKLQHDADIVNTLYQMVIDGTFLAIFKPMVNVGGQIIASDVVVPGAVTTLDDPNSDLRAINVGSDLRSGLETLAVVEKSINESSQEPLQQGASEGGTQTAYEISKLEQNANTVLGLFLQMISKHVKDFGKLRLGDILQYLTVPQVIDITGDMELSYKTFFLKGNNKGGKNKKMEFTNEVPDEMSEDDYLNASYEVLDENKKKNMEISKINPQMFRELQYMVTVSPDTMNPRSEDLERAFSTELFDRAIAHPEVFAPQEIGKLLLSTNPDTKRDIEKYLMKQPSPEQQAQMAAQQQNTMPNAGNSPLNAVMGKSPLNKGTSTPNVASLMGNR